MEALEHPLIMELEVGSFGSDLFIVYKFEAGERLNSTFQLSVTFTSRGDEVTPAALIGQEATLLVTFKGAEVPRPFHGLVIDAEEWYVGGAHPRRFLVQMAPKLWRLGQGRRSRIFQDKSVPDIVKEILGERGVAHELRLTNPYQPRPYCVQYQESDLAFISRLLEEEGIFYFFEHQPGAHTMVMGDAANVPRPIAGDADVKYRVAAGMTSSEDAVVAFATRRSVRPNKVSLRDFNYLTPSLNLEATVQGEGESVLEVYDHHGRYAQPAQGRIYARLRLEREQWPKLRAEGASHCGRLSVGATFTLDDYPDMAQNRRYLLISVSHSGHRADFGQTAAGPGEDRSQPSEYTNRFECIPAEVTYRPPRTAPRPSVGTQTAFVVGPGGEEIYTDEHGRVKVLFHWDREGGRNERASCWVRVNQGWAGPWWGALYLPRMGQEVIVEFEHGDPDRPIITGRVYNGATAPPVELPGNKTQSTMRSSSSPGGGGFNEFRFEDAAGSELVYLHAQKDFEIVVENDKDQTVKGNEKLVVRKDRTREIQQNQTLMVKGNDDTTVLQNQSLTVNVNRTTTVGGNHGETVGCDQSIDVGKGHTLTVGMASAETIGGAKSLRVGAAYQVSVGAAMSEISAGERSEAVGGAKTETVGGNKTETVKGDRTYEIEGNFSETVAKNRSLKVTKDVEVAVQGKHTHNVKKTYALSAKEIQFAAKDQLLVKVGKASILMKKNGDVVIKGGNIELTGSGDVVVKGSKVGQN